MMLNDDNNNRILALDFGGTSCKSWFNEQETTLRTDMDVASADEKTLLAFFRTALERHPDIESVAIALPCTIICRNERRRILETSTKLSRLCAADHGGDLARMEVSWAKALNANVFLIDD